MRIFKYILLLVVVCLSVRAAESNKTMADINIGSIGGAVFVQETHSDSASEGDWKRAWPGEVLLSHKRCNNAGVGIVFSRAFPPRSVDVLDITSGHILRVNALYESVEVVLFFCLCPSFKYCEDELFKSMLHTTVLVIIYSWVVSLTALRILN